MNCAPTSTNDDFAAPFLYLCVFASKIKVLTDFLGVLVPWWQIGF
jgi:hypothetical protein